jgi:hypothetical protein
MAKKEHTQYKSAQNFQETPWKYSDSAPHCNIILTPKVPDRSAKCPAEKHQIRTIINKTRTRRTRKDEEKGLLREHSSNLLLGQNDILHGILLALQILRFVVCV